jgi:hypothetical protein
VHVDEELVVHASVVHVEEQVSVVHVSVVHVEEESVVQVANVEEVTSVD